MEKIETYSDEIVAIFDELIQLYNLKKEPNNESSFFLKNSKVAIAAGVERYEKSIAFTLVDVKKGKFYSFLEIFKLKGCPKIEIDTDDDILVKNIKWHECFIRVYLKNEMEGDFANLKGVRALMPNSAGFLASIKLCLLKLFFNRPKPTSQKHIK